MLIMHNPFYYDKGSDVHDNIYVKIQDAYPLYSIEGFHSIAAMSWEAFKEFKENKPHESHDCHYLYFAVGNNHTAYMFNNLSRFWDIPKNDYGAYRGYHYPHKKFTKGINIQEVAYQKAIEGMIEQFISDAHSFTDETVMGRNFQYTQRMYDRALFEENNLDYEKYIEWNENKLSSYQMSDDYFEKRDLTTEKGVQTNRYVQDIKELSFL